MADINYGDFESIVLGGLSGTSPAQSNVVSLTSIWEQPKTPSTAQVLENAFNFG